MKKILLGDPAKFRVKSTEWRYAFPFTIGSARHGRTEVVVELVPAKPRADDTITPIKTLRLWILSNDASYYDAAKETNYCFNIPLGHCREILQFRHRTSTFADDIKAGFLESIWNVALCRDHKTTVLRAYPPDGATTLQISTLGSSASLWFT